MLIYFRYLPLAICLLILTACAPELPPVTPSNPWAYADLHALDPPEAANPELDLIAAYTRYAGSDLQIRFDLLEETLPPRFDLYLALDIRPGGTHRLPLDIESSLAWDTLLFLPAAGNPQAYLPDLNPSWSPGKDLFPTRGDLIPRFIRLPWIDSVVVSLNRAPLGKIDRGFRLQAFITSPGSTQPADTIGPISSNALPPGQAQVLLAFWNSFPAYTPAQALRRWDGAHTGPYGERHGLHVLLQQVRRYKVPVALLDLKTWASLSALEYTGGMPMVRNLAEEGLLILPDALPGSPDLPNFPKGLPTWAAARAASDSRQVALRFGLPASQLLYAPQLPPEPLGGYIRFFTIPDPDLPAGWPRETLLPIPLFPNADQPAPSGSTTSDGATSDGLALPVRLTLLESALNNQHSTRAGSGLLLGGNLYGSAFGDPQAAEASLAYLAAHPWIRPMTADDLLTAKVATERLVARNPVGASSSLVSPLLTQITEPNAEKGNPLELAAWQAALSLYAPLPPESPDLPALRASYRGQIYKILTAARWVEQPSPQVNCQVDVDLDGLPECVLASDRVFSIFELAGGRLIDLFVLRYDGVHQLIAPTTQFIVGLADPSTWELTYGDGADQAAVPGAFADHPPPWEIYTSVLDPGKIRFISPDRSVVKTFSLLDSGLRIDYVTSRPLTLQLPLALDPWIRFEPGWGEYYTGSVTEEGYTWSLGPELHLLVRTNLPFNTYPFNESHPMFRRVEDPNYAYPPGHYLPFPVSLVEIQGSRNFTIEIKLLSSNPDDF